eukprot:XP_001691913.1 predicted protein [Chlamydomonas reinhardtii]
MTHWTWWLGSAAAERWLLTETNLEQYEEFMARGLLMVRNLIRCDGRHVVQSPYGWVGLVRDSLAARQPLVRAAAANCVAALAGSGPGRDAIQKDPLIVSRTVQMMHGHGNGGVNAVAHAAGRKAVQRAAVYTTTLLTCIAVDNSGRDQMQMATTTAELLEDLLEAGGGGSSGAGWDVLEDSYNGINARTSRSSTLGYGDRAAAALSRGVSFADAGAKVTRAAAALNALQRLVDPETARKEGGGGGALSSHQTLQRALSRKQSSGHGGGMGADDVSSPFRRSHTTHLAGAGTGSPKAAVKLPHVMGFGSNVPRSNHSTGNGDGHATPQQPPHPRQPPPLAAGSPMRPVPPPGTLLHASHSHHGALHVEDLSGSPPGGSPAAVTSPHAVGAASSSGMMMMVAPSPPSRPRSSAAASVASIRGGGGVGLQELSRRVRSFELQDWGSYVCRSQAGKMSRITAAYGAVGSRAGSGTGMTGGGATGSGAAGGFSRMYTSEL